MFFFCFQLNFTCYYDNKMSKIWSLSVFSRENFLKNSENFFNFLLVPMAQLVRGMALGKGLGFEPQSGYNFFLSFCYCVLSISLLIRILFSQKKFEKICFKIFFLKYQIFKPKNFPNFFQNKTQKPPSSTRFSHHNSYYISWEYSEPSCSEMAPTPVPYEYVNFQPEYANFKYHRDYVTFLYFFTFLCTIPSIYCTVRMWIFNFSAGFLKIRKGIHPYVYKSFLLMQTCNLAYTVLDFALVRIPSTSIATIYFLNMKSDSIVRYYIALYYCLDYCCQLFTVAFCFGRVVILINSKINLKVGSFFMKKHFFFFFWNFFFRNFFLKFWNFFRDVEMYFLVGLYLLWSLVWEQLIHISLMVQSPCNWTFLFSMARLFWQLSLSLEMWVFREIFEFYSNLKGFSHYFSNFS